MILSLDSFAEHKIFGCLQEAACANLKLQQQEAAVQIQKLQQEHQNEDFTDTQERMRLEQALEAANLCMANQKQALEQSQLETQASFRRLQARQRNFPLLFI